MNLRLLILSVLAFATSPSQAEEIIMGLNATRADFIKTYGEPKNTVAWDHRHQIQIAGMYGMLKEGEITYSEFKTPAFGVMAYCSSVGKPLVVVYNFESFSPDQKVVYAPYDEGRIKNFMEKSKGATDWKEAYKDGGSITYDGTDRGCIVQRPKGSLQAIGFYFTDALKKN
jgi:hypothetical protein